MVLGVRRVPFFFSSPARFHSAAMSASPLLTASLPNVSPCSSHVTDSHSKTYDDAIEALNGLQSNAATLRESRRAAGGDTRQSSNIPLTQMFLQRAHIQLSSLDRLRVIHVSGTKGKGSTCAFVETLLRSLGFKTGFYSSPHLVAVRERIRLNGRPLCEDAFTRHFFTLHDRLRKAAQEAGDNKMPAYFKFLTLMAFQVFLAEQVDVAVMEVGIGGAFDCTNVVQRPVVCGVSTLDLDHTQLLGTKLEDIAWHKGGIFKPGAAAVTSPQEPDALEVLRRRAEEVGENLVEAPSVDDFDWPGGIQPQFGIAGRHQAANVSLALLLVRKWLRVEGREKEVFEDSWDGSSGYKVPERLVKALRECRWSGRTQVVEKGRVTFFLDGAHTPKSMELCAHWYKEESTKRAENRRSRYRVLMFHCTADRDERTLLAPLQKVSFDMAIFTPPILGTGSGDHENRMTTECALLQKAHTNADFWKTVNPGSKTLALNGIVPALQEMEKLDGEVEVLVTGSLHLVGGLLGVVAPDEA